MELFQYPLYNSPSISTFVSLVQSSHPNWRRFDLIWITLFGPNIIIFYRYQYLFVLRQSSTPSILSSLSKRKKKKNKENLIQFLRNDFIGRAKKRCSDRWMEKEGRKTGWEFLFATRSWLERSVKAARGNAFLDLPSVELINEVSCVPSSDGTWFIAAT